MNNHNKHYTPPPASPLPSSFSLSLVRFMLRRLPHHYSILTKQPDCLLRRKTFLTTDVWSNKGITLFCRANTVFLKALDSQTGMVQCKIIVKGYTKPPKPAWNELRDYDDSIPFCRIRRARWEVVLVSQIQHFYFSQQFGPGLAVYTICYQESEGLPHMYRKSRARDDEYTRTGTNFIISNCQCQ